MMLIAGIQSAIKLHVVLSAALCVHHINVAYMYTSLAFVDIHHVLPVCKV